MKSGGGQDEGEHLQNELYKRDVKRRSYNSKLRIGTPFIQQFNKY